MRIYLTRTFHTLSFIFASKQGFGRRAQPAALPLVINYPEISAAIGVRNWMDASSSNWMTLPFLEALQILMDLVEFQYS